MLMLSKPLVAYFPSVNRTWKGPSIFFFAQTASDVWCVRRLPPSSASASAWLDLRFNQEFHSTGIVMTKNLMHEMIFSWRIDPLLGRLPGWWSSFWAGNSHRATWTRKQIIFRLQRAWNSIAVKLLLPSSVDWSSSYLRLPSMGRFNMDGRLVDVLVCGAIAFYDKAIDWLDYY